jgi:hypothetical protein
MRLTAGYQPGGVRIDQGTDAHYTVGEETKRALACGRGRESGDLAELDVRSPPVDPQLGDDREVCLIEAGRVTGVVQP